MTDAIEDKKNSALSPRLNEEIGDDDDEDDEDVTDVWDEAKLKAALGDLHRPREKAPATQSEQENEASIQVAMDHRSPKPMADTDPPPPIRGREGLSWPITIILALSLAAAVYVLIRVLKG